MNPDKSAQFVSEKPHFIPGIYRHYKGDLYAAHGISRHTETGEWFVNYCKCEPSDLTLWSRPFSMWHEEIETSDGIKTRFKLICGN